MNVLAFDTCLGAVSVAVRWQGGRGEWLVREAYEPRTRGQAERLMPMIAEVMEGAGLAYAAVDCIAVTVGPGSFTGARVGVAAARGLALATGKPVVGVTSLAAMAHRAGMLLGATRGNRRLAVAVEAPRGMVFLQLFAADGSELSPALLLSPDQAAQSVGSGPILLVGSGAAAVAGLLTGGEAEARMPDLQPHARALAMLAPGRSPMSPVEPLYLRPPDAKPQGDKSLPRAV